MAIRWIEEVSEGEERDIGKKADALARLSDYGLNIPRGFVVTAPTFEEFVRSNGLENQIESILNNADRSDINSVRRAQNRIKDLIMNADMAGDVREEIEEAYEKINMSEEVRNAGGDAVDLVGGQRETEFVAVRSSPTGTRIPGAHRNTLNVNGKSSVVRQVKECWASLYSAEALSIEEHVGSIHSMAVVVQRMVEPEVSGAAFSSDPLNPDSQHYLVEALWGLGTALFDGNSTPDRFVVDQNGSVRENDIVNKEWKIVRDPTSGKNIKQRVSHDDRESPSLQSRDLERVVDALQKLDGRFGTTFRLDFVVGRTRMYILDVERFSPSRQSRERRREQNQRTVGEPFLSGRAASPGDARGPVRILYNDTGIDTVNDEDIMAVVTASEQLIPVLPDASGVVADRGGIAANLSTIARKLGVPAVVGMETATDMLTQSEPVTLDGGAGTIREDEPDTGKTDTFNTGMETGTAMSQNSRNSEQPQTVTDTMTATRLKVLGSEPTDAVDGAVVPDYTNYDRARRIADQHRPERVWVRTESQGQPTDEHVGILAQHRHNDIDGKGAVLSSYGEVMRSNNLVDRGAAFIGLDVDSLKQEGDRDSLMNSIQKIGEETRAGCESAVLLRKMDHELVEAAVESGIDTIVVPSAHVHTARKTVARAEKRFMLQKLRTL